MAFELRVDEQTEIRKRRETLKAEMCGYDVWVTTDEQNTHLTVSPVDWQNGIRMGIFDCYPKSVAEIEAFAEVAGDLFRAIAKEMREAGKDDLRSEWEKRSDEFREQSRKAIDKMLAERG